MVAGGVNIKKQCIKDGMEMDLTKVQDTIIDYKKTGTTPKRVTRVYPKQLTIYKGNGKIDENN